jgi:hypothetical protein
MQKNDSISASSQREIIFSHLTLISVRENEKISRDSQEILMRKFVRKPDESRESGQQMLVQKPSS